MGVKILLYGNCQVQALSCYLRYIIPDSEVYVLPPNFRLIDGSEAIDEQDVAFISSMRSDDCIVYQPLDSRHSSHGIDAVTQPFLKSKPNSISIPYVVFKAYFPDAFSPNPKSAPTDEYPFGQFPYGHHWIDDAIAGNYDFGVSKASIQHILELKAREYDFSKAVQDTVTRLSDKETNCDISVSDFILDGYQSVRLFHTFNHPTVELFSIIVERLMGLMQHSCSSLSTDQEDVVGQATYPMHQLPIYPGVSEALGLRFDSSVFNWGSISGIGLERYIMDYSKSCFGGKR